MRTSPGVLLLGSSRPGPYTGCEMFPSSMVAPEQRGDKEVAELHVTPCHPSPSGKRGGKIPYPTAWGWDIGGVGAAGCARGEAKDLRGDRWGRSTYRVPRCSAAQLTPGSFQFQPSD